MALKAQLRKVLNKKRDFLSLKNMQYFKAGVASPDARPRLHEILTTVVNLINHYDFLGDDEIKEFFKEHGIEFNVIAPQFEDGPVVITKDDTKNFERSWKFAMNNEKTPDTKNEVLNMILDRALEVQKGVENKKEEIDKTADEVDAECQVKKPFFMKALGIKLAELKKRSIDNALKRIEDDVEASRDIISVFNEAKEDAVEVDQEEEKE